MIQICTVSTQPLTARHPLKLQRAMAGVAQMNVRKTAQFSDDAFQSISHCRGIAGAAISNSGPIGLDIEYADINRDWPGILNVFHDTLPKLTASQSARIWTFLEAWFKSFARYPTPAEIDVFNSVRDNTALQIARNVHAWARELRPDFQICIVWKGEAQSPTLSQSNFQQTAP